MTTKTIASVGLALILTALAVQSAEAKRVIDAIPDRHAPEGRSYQIHATVTSVRPSQRRNKIKHRQKRDHVPVRYAGNAQIVSHPAGCPSRSFCGCGAAQEVFKQITGIVAGINIRDLWLADNWRKIFPRTAPAPGMVAARRGHVFVIREVRGPGLVLAYDANSGGHKTRIHLRRLAGYTVVNPRAGSRYAKAG